jgi:hypothetical protein
VLGAIYQFEKTSMIAKLSAARKRKREANGKCEGRKSHVELNPDLVKQVRQLRRKRPKGGRMSLRSISGVLAQRGYLNERGNPFNPKSISAMLMA